MKIDILLKHGKNLKPESKAYQRSIQPLTHPTVANSYVLSYGTKYQRADLTIVDWEWSCELSLVEAEDLVERIARDKGHLLYTIDENILDEHLLSEISDKLKTETLMVVRYLVRAADGVIVPTENLQERLSRLNENIFVIKKPVNESGIERIPVSNGSNGKTKIGYLGKESDLLLVLEGLRSVLKKHQEKVEFQLITDSDMSQAFAGLPVKILAAKNEPETLDFNCWVDKIQWDIAIVPLENNPVTRCKSDLQFLEYSKLGIAGIYSLVPAYAQTITHQKTGYLVPNKTENWVETLELLIGEEQLRQKLGKQAQEYVLSNRNIEKIAIKWQDVIEEIVSGEEGETEEWEKYFQQGMQLEMAGKLHEAIATYQQAVFRNPENSASYHHLGDTLLKLGHWEEAGVAYKQAIKLNPEYFWSSYNLGVAYLKENKLEEAIALYQNSIKLNPGSYLPYKTLKEILLKQWENNFAQANIALKEGDRVRAIVLYHQTIEKYRKNIYLPDNIPPKEIPETPKVLLVVDHFLPQCLRYRVKQKIEQLEEAGITAEYFPWTEVVKAKNLLYSYHVVIFYRVPAFPDIVETIEYAKAINKVVFYEIDDLVFDEEYYPDPIESYGGYVGEDEYESLQRGCTLFREAMALCDYGIASTVPLAKAMEKVLRKKQCYLHRNALDKLNYDFLALNIPKIERDYLSIFYGTGTKAHNADFNELVAPALAQILENYPQVRLTLMGYLTLPPELTEYEERIDRIDVIKEVEIYWEFLRQADINIAVLHATPVNNCKSELKWFEAAVMGIPSVVSNTETYLEVVEHGVDGLIASTPEEWYENLELLLTDEKLRLKIAETARQRVWERYSLPVMGENIKQIIQSGIENATKAGKLVPRTQKQKLLIVNVFYPPQSIGGGTRIVRDNVDILTEKYGDKYEICVFTSDDDNPNPYEIKEYSYKGIWVTKVSTPMMVGMDWQYQNSNIYDIFTQYLEFVQPDLIHFHCVQRLTASVLEAAAAMKIPYVVTAHDAWWISDNQFLVNEAGEVCDYQQNDPLVIAREAKNVIESFRRRQYLRSRLNEASAVLTVSETFAELYRLNGIAQTKSNRNGIMPRPKLPRRPNPTRRVRLAHVGGVAAHKGYFLLKEAVETAKLKNTELIVIDHAQTMGSTRQEKWGKTPVTFIAKVEQEKMPEFYSKIDVLIAPSTWPESYGLVTREAAAAGVWVVASNIGALAEDLILGVNGDSFDPDEIDELVTILQRIDKNPEKYQQLVSEAIHVRTTAEQVQELVGVYEGIRKEDKLIKVEENYFREKGKLEKRK